jgi:large subunit ribosomal protein L10
MPSQKNIDAVATLKDKLADAKSVVLADYSGLSVVDQTRLRLNITDAGGEFTVAKNNLIKLALEKELVTDAVLDALNGPTAVLFSNKDAVAALKALVEFSKEHELPQVKLGFMDGKVLTLDEVKQLASLPGRDELMAKLVSQLKAPTYGLVNVLQGNLRGLVQALKQYKEKKEQTN